MSFEETQLMSELYRIRQEITCTCYELDDSVNPHVCQQCYDELEAESEQSKADDSVNPYE